jgi:hypothetical protein
MEPQLGEHDQPGPDVNFVGRGDCRGLLEHRADGPEIVYRLHGQAVGISRQAQRPAGGQPEPGAVHNTRVRRGNLVQDGRGARHVRDGTTFGLVFEHGRLPVVGHDMGSLAAGLRLRR